VAQRGVDSGEWATVSYKCRKAIRPVIEDMTNLGFLLGMEVTGRKDSTLQEDAMRIILRTHAISLVVHVILTI